ncbi:MAG: hypothetical protein ACUVQP_03000 [Bacteroidales bacterium]
MKVCFFFILILFVSCKPILLPIKATSQHWCIKEKNIEGINYHILLKTHASFTDLKLDSITINKNSINDYSYSVIGKSTTEQRFQKGDTIIVSFNKIGSNKADTIRIFYHLKQRQKSIIIAKTKELQSLCP